MKAKLRRSLSWLLSLMMIFTMMPGSALWAYADSDAINETFTYGDVGSLQVDPVEGATYQWLVYNEANQEFETITGAESSSYQLPERTSAGAYEYACDVTVDSDPQRQSFMVTVEPKELEVTWTVDENMVYDGTSQSVPTASIDPDDLLSGDSCTVSVVIKQESETVNPNELIHAGNYTAVASFSNDNYAATEATEICDFTIEPKTAEITWGSTSLVYDGYYQSPSATVSNLETGDVCDVYVEGEEMNVDTDYIATVSDLDNPNYKLPDQPVTTTFSITPRPLTITALDQIIEKNGTIETDVYQVEVRENGLCDGDVLDSVQFSLASTVDTSQPSDDYINDAILLSNARIKYADKDVTGNYEITYNKGALKVVNRLAAAPVLEKQPESVQMDYGDLLYSGEDSLDLTVGSVTVPEGDTASIQWYKTDGPNQSGTAISGETGPTLSLTGEALNPGDHYYYCEVTNNPADSGLEPRTVRSDVAKVSINLKNVLVKVKNQVVKSGETLNLSEDQLQYDGLLPGHHIEFDNLGFYPASGSTVTSDCDIMITFDNYHITDSNNQDVTNNFWVSTELGWCTVVDEDDFVEFKGYIRDGDAGGTFNNGIENATVTLEKGDTQFGTVTTGEYGYFEISAPEPGLYNLVVTKDQVTSTFMAEVPNENPEAFCMHMTNKLSSGIDNSVAGELRVLVDGLDGVAVSLNNSPEAYGISNSGLNSINVVLSVTSDAYENTMSGPKRAAFEEGREAIQELSGASGLGLLEFFDMSLNATVNGSSTEIPLHNTNVLHVVIPYDTYDRKIRIFRYHDGAAEELRELATKPSGQFEDGTFYVGDGEIHIYTGGFSTYAIAETEADPEPTPGGGGGGGRSSGGVVTEPAKTPETPEVQEPALGDPTTVIGFTDVDPDAYYAEAVQWAVGKNITNGKSATLFGPGDSCNRAEMMTFLWRAAGCPEPTGMKGAAGFTAASVRIGDPGVTSVKSKFSDVQPGTYFYKAVLWGTEQGIIKGTGDNKFRPYDLVTRAQAVTFLYRALGSKAVTDVAGANGTTGAADSAGTTDVTGAAGAAEQTGGTGQADAAGVTGGTDVAETGATGTTGAADVTEGSGTTETGAAGAANMTGTTDATGATGAAGTTDAAGTAGTIGAAGTTDVTGTVHTASVTTGTTVLGFTDVPEGAYYADAVKWAVARGITRGTSATTFSPNYSCTRGQIVTFLYRAYN